jgi:hypothetical protein
MHLFYASLEITVLPIIEAICLVIQILFPDIKANLPYMPLYPYTPGIYFPNLLLGRRRSKFYV